MIETCLFIVAPLFVAWCLFRLTLPNQLWEFDWDTAHATFFLIYDRATKIAAGMALVDLFSIWTARDRGSRTLCLAGLIYSFAFLIHLTVAYEAYLHARYQRDGTIGPSSYTTGKYALTLATSSMAILASVAGLILMVIDL